MSNAAKRRKHLRWARYLNRAVALGGGNAIVPRGAARSARRRSWWAPRLPVAVVPKPFYPRMSIRAAGLLIPYDGRIVQEAR